MGMNLLHMIKELNTGDPDETVKVVFDEAGVPEKWRLFFAQIVRNECRRVQRCAVHSREEGSEPIEVTADSLCGVVDRLAEHRWAFLKDRFATGRGGYVLWETATVEDHRSRIEMLERLRSGLKTTIDRHKAAIELINANPGATCLIDVIARAS